MGLKIVIEQEDSESEDYCTCPKCGAECESEDKYCCECGAKLPVVQQGKASARLSAMKGMIADQGAED
jgi:predicted amidophosphoribosyltransferase